MNSTTFWLRLRSTGKCVLTSVNSRRCSNLTSKRSCSTASAPTQSSRTCCSIRVKARANAGPPDLNALVSESLSLAYHGARAERSDFNITLRQELDPDAGAVEVYPQEITR